MDDQIFLNRRFEESIPVMVPKSVSLLLLLIVSASIADLPNMSNLATPMVHPTPEQSPGPDFSLTANPTSLVLQPDGSQFTDIKVNPIGGFSGFVTLTGSVSPVVQNDPTWLISVNPVISGGDEAVIIAVHGTPTGTYVVTITGSNGTTSRAVNVEVVVTGPDFTLSSIPTSVNTQGTTDVVSLNVTSIHDSSGMVSFVDLGLTPYSPVGLSLAIGPASVNVAVNGSVFAQLFLVAPSNATPGFYNIHVTAASSSMSTSVVIPMSLGPIPAPPVFVKNGLKWKPKLDLSQNPSRLETWTAQVANSANIPLYVQMSIILTSNKGDKITTLNPIPVLIQPGTIGQIVVNQFFSTVDIGKQYCFTAVLTYGAVQVFLPFSSPDTQSGCFKIT